MRKCKRLLAGIICFSMLLSSNGLNVQASSLDMVTEDGNPVTVSDEVTTETTTEITTEITTESVTENTTEITTQEFEDKTTEIAGTDKMNVDEALTDSVDNLSEELLGAGQEKYVYDGVVYDSVYDFNYYINKYPDIAAQYGSNPDGALKHFVDYGMKEGRQASEEFNVNYYKNRYSDLRQAYGNDKVKYYKHYIQYGAKEHRDAKTECALQNPTTIYNGVNYSTVYNYSYYLSHNSDVKAVIGEDEDAVLKHFIDYGMKEGRQGSEEFNVNYYKNRYSDLRQAYGSDKSKYYSHYMNYGKKEKRDAKTECVLQNPTTIYKGVNYSAVYNYNYYLTHNSDVKKAFGEDDEAVLKHFVEFGMKEGRQASEEFNVDNYKNRYSDLRAVFGNNRGLYYKHYMEYGQKEKRDAKTPYNKTTKETTYKGVDYSLVYDYDYYISHNADVKAAFGEDDYAVLEHFVEFGMKEGRQGKASFDVNSYRCANPDLRKIYRSNLPDYYKHYIEYGHNENRVATGVSTLQSPWTVYNGMDYSYAYNYWTFRTQYPEIAAHYGLDDYGQLEYFVAYINKMTLIMGAPTTNVDQMVRYFNAYATYPSFYATSDAPDIRTFCQIFYDEAVAEGVDPAVAFCQTMKETGYLRFGGQVSITQYNFAGLGATDGGAAGAGFSSVRQGVRAQVQHLKAYATTAGLTNSCVDPRYSLVTKGSAPYVEWLGIQENPYHKGWATAQRYGYSILSDYMSKLKQY